MTGLFSKILRTKSSLLKQPRAVTIEKDTASKSTSLNEAAKLSID